VIYIRVNVQFAAFIFSTFSIFSLKKLDIGFLGCLILIENSLIVGNLLRSAPSRLIVTFELPRVGFEGVDLVPHQLI